ncbi:MAG: hypothetical protein INR71_05395, partial [Terriglobus roseus]|nr:hypothetical protein [Terriglobus roseus]
MAADRGEQQASEVHDADMDGDLVMADAPAHANMFVAESIQQHDFAAPAAASSSSSLPSPPMAAARPSKIPQPSPHATPAKENAPLRHKISATRLAQTAIVKKQSSDGLMSRSPLKSSLSLQSLLSPRRSVRAAKETSVFTFSKPLSRS